MTYDRNSFGESDSEPGTKILQWFVDDHTKEGARCYIVLSCDSLPCSIVPCNTRFWRVVSSCIRTSGIPAGPLSCTWWGATTETTTINQGGVIVSCRKVAELLTLTNMMLLGPGYGPGDVVELIEGMLRAQPVFPPLAWHR